MESGDSPYIGVSKDYLAPNRRYGAPGVVHSNVRGLEQVPAKAAPRFTKASLDAMLSDTAPEDVFRMQRALSKAGLIGPKTRVTAGFWDDTTVSAYKKLLGFANRHGFESEVEALEAYAAGREAGLDLDGDGVADDAADAPFSGKKTRTDRSVNLSDPASARQLLRKTLSDKLGRSPRRDEFDQFVGALRSFERANPSVSTTTQEYADDELVGTSTTSSGGLSEGAYTGFAEEYAQAGKLGEEANTFRVATDYYAAAMDALKSPL